jgi:hypothetical protein
VTEWLLGTGYIHLRERLHRAEESLIMVAPVERVIAGARFDELRLIGSTIQNRDELQATIRSAIEVLSGYAQIATAVAVAPAAVAGAGAGAMGGIAPNLPAAAGAAPIVYRRIDERLARENLRQVRRAINEFRNECRVGLVRARNQLLRTVTATSFVSYLLLALAVRAGVPSESAVAAATFFLVGAVVGLFNRLQLDASAQSAIEDYGLSAARLLHTPIVSGIAALGGVMIVPMLSALVNVPDASAGTILPAVSAIFNLTGRPFGLVIAAIFGLSPATLISRLQQESEQYKTGLKSSEAPQAK